MHEWGTRMLLKHYLDQGMTKAELSRRFGVSRRTIHYWIESGELDRDLARGQTRSPRGRGNRARKSGGAASRGSIPAWAGKPPTPLTPAVTPWVHPRVGGETDDEAGDEIYRRGPSPRGRGNRPLGGPAGVVCGSIPAWAGKPGICTQSPTLTEVHPRVGGETSRRSGSR